MKLGTIIVACVGVLITASILIPTVAVCGPSKETGITQSRMSQLAISIELYNQAYGDYPEFTNNQTLLACLAGENPRRLKFYLPSDNEIREGALADAWKHPIHIRRFGKARQLRSAGKDGILYTRDDILQEVGRPQQR